MAEKKQLLSEFWPQSPKFALRAKLWNGWRPAFGRSYWELPDNLGFTPAHAAAAACNLHKGFDRW